MRVELKFLLVYRICSLDSLYVKNIYKKQIKVIIGFMDTYMHRKMSDNVSMN